MPQLSVRADGGVGSIAMSPGGRDIVLASRNGVYVLDLQDPFSAPRWLPLHSAGEVANIQWCPSSHHPTWVVSSSDQTAVVWNLALPSYRAIEHVLHGHTRAVTDINFGPHHPSLLATCSIDTTINAWDLRDPAKPCLKFAEFLAGAAQAKWSRSNENLLASAHDSRINIWDRRRNNLPLKSYRAHSGKINGLSFDRDDRIITCSTDRTVKVWNWEALPNSNKLAAESSNLTIEHSPITISTDFPVWRALPTPTGLGCFVVPLRGGANNVSLVKLDKEGDQSLSDTIIDTYSGHEQPVREAVWRHSHSNNHAWDLLTWSKDSILRMWSLPSDQMNSMTPHSGEKILPCNDHPDVTYHDEPTETENFGTNRAFFELPMAAQNKKENAINQLDWIAHVHLSPQNSKSPAIGSGGPGRESRLSHKSSSSTALTNLEASISREVTQISAKFPKIIFERVDIATGLCVLTLRRPAADTDQVNVLRVILRFPNSYPWQPLEVTVEEDLNVSPQAIADMEAQLETSLAKLASHGAPSVEFCVRFLMNEQVDLDDLLANIKGDWNLPPNPLESSGESDSESDEVIDLSALTSDSESEDMSDADSSQLLSRNSDDEAVNEILLQVANDTIPAVDSTPLPRQCGGHFSARGILVCFFNQKDNGNAVDTSVAPVPLDKVFGDSDSDTDSIFESDSDDFDPPESGEQTLATANWSIAAARLTTKVQHDNMESHPASEISAIESSHKVLSPRHHTRIVLKDCYNIMPCRPDIAAQYKLNLENDSLLDVLQHNRKVALDLGRPEDAYFWQLSQAYVVLNAPDEKPTVDMAPMGALKPYIHEWTVHPLGPSYVLKAIVQHLEETQNYQLLGSASCILASFRRKELVNQGQAFHDYIKFPEAQSSTEFRLNCRNQESRGLLMLDIVPVSHNPELPHPLTSIHTPASQTGITPLGMSPYSAGFSSIPHLSRRDTQVSLDRMSFVDGEVAYSNSRSLQTPGETGQYGSSVGVFSSRGSASASPSLALPGNGTRFKIQVMDGAVYDHESISGAGGATGHALVPTSWEAWRPKMDMYRTIYARLLESWGLNIQRLEVLKHLSVDGKVDPAIAEEEKDFKVRVDVSNDTCIYCGQAIRTKFSYCGKCGHMMHSSCASSWWAEGNQCATGCGCTCLDYV